MGERISPEQFDLLIKDMTKKIGPSTVQVEKSETLSDMLSIDLPPEEPKPEEEKKKGNKKRGKNLRQKIKEAERKKPEGETKKTKKPRKPRKPKAKPTRE